MSTFIHFKSAIENLLNYKVKTLRTNYGEKYTNSDFQAYCPSNGIFHQYTCPHTPQQNGVARKHKHIIETQLDTHIPPIPTQLDTHTDTQSSSLPTQPPPSLPITNTHPMQTRQKSGISKKKMAFTSNTVNYLDVEPPSFSIASALTPWIQAMEDEFYVLQRQGT